MTSRSLLSAVSKIGKPHQSLYCQQRFIRLGSNNMSTYAMSPLAPKNARGPIQPYHSPVSLPGIRNFQTGSCNSASWMTCAECKHSYTKDLDNFVELVSCPKCDSLQKMPKKELPNYFQILGHPKCYRVKVSQIANRAKQLQKIFHPDLYGGKCEAQQDISQEYSSLINKALSTLSDPVQRSRYMLFLEGIRTEDPKAERITTNDEMFLKQIMMLNEELEQIGDPFSWQICRDKNLLMLQDVDKELEQAFEIEDLEQAEFLIGKMKFFDSIQNRLKELQGRMGIVE